MRVVINLEGVPLEFTPINSGGKFPFLDSVGSLRIEARAGSVSGFGSGAAPTASFVLDNANNVVSDLIGAPLRALTQIYDDDDVLTFAGLVSSIRFGSTLEVTLEG